MKIVSYKWLSLSLSLHVSKATQALEQYVNRNNNNEQLNIIYFLGGKVTTGTVPSYRYKLVKADCLEEAKKSFDSVSTCHIYSIQKCEVKDASVLYTSNLDVVKEHLTEINKCSGIECSVLKDFSETTKERTGSCRVVPVMNGSHDQKKKTGDDDICRVQPIENPTPVAASNKEKQKPKKETTTKSFFGKASTKKNADSSAKPAKSVEETTTKDEGKSS